MTPEPHVGEHSSGRIVRNISPRPLFYKAVDRIRRQSVIGQKESLEFRCAAYALKQFVAGTGDQTNIMSFMSEKVLLFWDWRWVTTAVVFLLSYVVVRFYHKVFKYPKGPFPLPIVGNLLTLRNINELYEATEAWARKYGDPITLWMGEKPMVVLNTQTLVKEAFIERRHDFAGRLPTKMGELQTLGNHDIIFEDYNPRWKALRNVALTAVRKYAVSESLDTLCCQVVDAYVDSLKEGPNVVDSKVPFEYMLYNIIGMSVYGAKFDGESPELAELQAINREFFKVAPNGLPSDIVPWLGLLYRARERKIELLFKKGWKILDDLYKRASKSYVPGQDRPKLQDREKLPYTQACILESLRMYPNAPLGIPHSTSCDTEVGGKFVPKDTGILYNIYAINHDPNLWDDPEAFRPERFLDPVTGKVKQELLPQLMTFGLGPRTCPGEKLAHVDMFYVLVRFMQRVEISAPEGKANTAIAPLGSSLFLIPGEQDVVLTRKD
ncbi:cytochrome P450, putative [Ixodes scapularis]|uniref:Cytochrome P450, putative n=1 Tax=Ixodes scapularis TaxID=6945 RepID=B7QA82_IXOSC|nr:cytochrome P450, putative [Ixodes scapularis]|eukprot:XP_002400108.1 cytochrome P450, putative [Ixodes scapularis]